MKKSKFASRIYVAYLAKKISTWHVRSFKILANLSYPLPLGQKMEISVALVTVSVAIAVVSWWVWRTLKWVWFKPKMLESYLRRQGLSGTPYTPLVGDLKRNFSMLAEARSKPIKLTDDIATRITPFPLQMLKTHGRTFFTWFGTTPTITIMDPEQIKEAFNKIYDFQKPHTFPLGKVIATGLANYDGEKWAKHRRIINPAFHLEKIKKMVPAFHQSCSEVVGEWDKLVSEKGSSCEVDVWPGLVTITADVISRTAFGSSYKEGQRIFELQAELAQLIIQSFLKSFIPGYLYLPTKSNRRMKAAAREIQVILRGIVNKRLRAREAGEAPSDDLLGILLESNLGQAKGTEMSTEDVMEECKLFYFAGQETTSVLLVWTMVLLSQHQEWQARAREEVKQVFEDKEPDTDGLNQLKVMTMILYEVLRLYPPVAQLNRAIHKEMKLGDLTLPGGVQINLPILLVQHDTKLWGNDAAEFKPERFKDGISKATKSQVCFFPFGWGPRICIGQNFAILEAKMAMALILQRFSFELSPSYVHAPYTVVTLHPQFDYPTLSLSLEEKMEISLASVTVAIAIAVVSWWTWRTLKWVWFKPKMIESYLRRQGLSGTPYTPLVGDLKRNSSMLAEARSKPIKLTDDIQQRVVPFPLHMLKTYGRTFFTWFGHIPTVTIMDPEQIKEVLNKVYDFQKSPAFPLGRLIAAGLVSDNGEKWAKHRRIINPAFHLEKIKIMVPAFHQSCSEVVGEWDKLVSEKGSSCEVDVWPGLVSLTADVISRTAFGSSYKEGQRIFELQAELAQLIIQVFRKVVIPGYMYLPTKNNRRIKAAAREVQVILRGIVDKRLRAREAGEAPCNDLLGILLESNRMQAKGNGMSIKEVMEECKLFYFAGQETTSALLVWTMVLLSQHQDWQARAREEVKQVFGDKEPDADGLNHLKVMTTILYEVLRLYPSITHVTRTVHKETKLGDLTLPAGVHISLPILLVQRDTELWGDDAAEFKPERFSEGLSKATKSQVSFFPFTWGPRVCIGQNFALLEAKMAMSLILQRFSFELSPSYVHAPYPIVTIQPQFGAQIILHKL
ncbi:unnamed protein product [Thlaspi arvense]|uniref:Cytochrome P450 n=1 Tax=Thlaspi arvense TaxID=13288 RepID=A0AAU9S2V5_THLAR|nr:unnamed protein product [Thlaspi arvense]